MVLETIQGMEQQQLLLWYPNEPKKKKEKGKIKKKRDKKKEKRKYKSLVEHLHENNGVAQLSKVLKNFRAEIGIGDNVLQFQLEITITSFRSIIMNWQLRVRKSSKQFAHIWHQNILNLQQQQQQQQKIRK
jgi:hypothetical protein